MNCRPHTYKHKPYRLFTMDIVNILCGLCFVKQKIFICAYYLAHGSQLYSQKITKVNSLAELSMVDAGFVLKAKMFEM